MAVRSYRGEKLAAELKGSTRSTRTGADVTRSLVTVGTYPTGQMADPTAEHPPR